jgi:hypothetical protein
VLSKWKEFFEQHLNELLEEDDISIDLPNREEVAKAIEYLKNNKAAGLDSIAAELLKSGGPCLVNALTEMIQQVWIGETLPESWTEGYCVQCIKKAINLNARIIAASAYYKCSV